MDIGVPLEVSASERRVALTPAAVDRLVRRGNRVFVEKSAGIASGFTDDEYLASGAQLAYNGEEVFRRADLLLKIHSPTPEEFDYLAEGKILMCFLRPGVISPEGFQALRERNVYAVAMEMIEDWLGNAPILRAVSEIAGPMSIHIAAHLLESGSGGRGILLGGAPGIPPAVVVILGAGSVGTTATRVALGNRAQVMVLDRDMDGLRTVDALFGSGVTTMFADRRNIARSVAFADVLIGAVMIRGGRTPHLVTEEMIRSMKPGSVAIDVSVDHGGCLETGRPTSVEEPTFVMHDVVHYAVPNMTTNVARTATYALTQAGLPYVMEIAENGIERACTDDHGLCHGLITAHGKCLHPLVAEQFGADYVDPFKVLATDWVNS